MPKEARRRTSNGDDVERPTVLALCLRAVASHPKECLGTLVVLSAMSWVYINALFMQPGPHPAPFFAPAVPVPDVPRAAAPPAPKTTAAPAVTTGTVAGILPRPRPSELDSGARQEAPATSTRPRAEIVMDIQRELSRRGFYDGSIDGVYGPRTDAAIRDFDQAAGLRSGTEPTEALLRSITKSNAKAAATTSGASSAIPVRHDPVADLIGPSRRVLAIQRALSDYGYGQIKLTGVINPETESAIEKFERERKLPITGQVSERLVRELSAMSGRPID